MAFIGQGAWTIGTESGCQTGIVSQTVTGIPVTATQIRFNYYNISSTGSSYFYFRLGTSSGEVSSGYKAHSGYHYFANTDSTSSYFTDRIGLTSTNWDAASYKWTGYVDVVKLNDDGTTQIWGIEMYTNDQDANYGSSNRIQYFGRGFCTLASNAHLDRVSIHSDGTNYGQFDSGRMRVDYLV